MMDSLLFTVAVRVFCGSLTLAGSSATGFSFSGTVMEFAESDRAVIRLLLALSARADRAETLDGI